MTKNYFIALFSIVLAGCVTPPTPTDDKNLVVGRTPLADGLWIGTIHWQGTNANDGHIRSNGKPFSGDIQFMVTVCDGQGKFWGEGDDGRFHAKLVTYHNDSNFGNHLIYYQNTAEDVGAFPDWVETQSMLLIEINSSVLRAQWSRSVSNPRLVEDDIQRDFYLSGVGTLVRTVDACPQDILKGVRYDDK